MKQERKQILVNHQYEFQISHKRVILSSPSHLVGGVSSIISLGKTYLFVGSVLKQCYRGLGTLVMEK
uniref:Uncharacterized protein n=1 Tax=Picea glauca TaxID=3330 RepID=A0A101M472_PICGL|nr:hypothetical protein ABT39_MTgene497 [Picea glauca]